MEKNNIHHKWREMWEKRELKNIIKRYKCLHCLDEVEIDMTNQKVISYKRDGKKE